MIVYCDIICMVFTGRLVWKKWEPLFLFIEYDNTKKSIISGTMNVLSMIEGTQVPYLLGFSCGKWLPKGQNKGMASKSTPSSFIGQLSLI